MEEINKIFYRNISLDTLEIKWNENPVKMDLFLSFLSIPMTRTENYSNTGWTQLYNRDHDLFVLGGEVGGIEYLDSIEYKKNLHNPYNDFVTPLNLFDILSGDGKKFFIEYYRDDISSVFRNINEEAEKYRSFLLDREKEINLVRSEMNRIGYFD